MVGIAEQRVTIRNAMLELAAKQRRDISKSLDRPVANKPPFQRRSALCGPISFT
ncbi:hypothetical protein SOASR031_06530 [Leminorella grimontii]|nr:hypothetical protein SOASR031_06530 [Leminorella grimontii]